MSGQGPQHPSISGSIPAGWYPDPAGGAGRRWWDGTTWTANVQEPEAPPPLPTFGSYVPADLRPSTPLPVAEAGVAYTRASWWIAGSPLWVVVPQVAIVQIFNSLAPLPIPTLMLAIALFTALALAILIGLAFADRSGLINGGNNSVASPWWTLLTPLAYLIARARQVQLYATGGWASVIWWCLAAILTPGVAVLTVFAVYGIVAN
ncbi:MAG: hypothetical protein QOH69_1141 [Actinomycetota bacterium]|jgi:hypothetical protein|nr:hypothetical protein [Actinomycetota bacterium]